MRTRIATSCLTLWLIALPVAAAAEEPAPASSPATHAQGPGQVDARFTLNTDVLLAFFNVGVGADVGVLPLGPGTLAVGGEFEFGACGTVCLALGLATGLQFSHFYYSPHARLTYHLGLPRSPQVDAYGLVLAGITYTTTRVGGTSNGTVVEVVGQDIAPSVGLGAGAKYFVRDNLFLGAEARLRVASGQYEVTLRSGNVTLRDSETFWSLSGLNVQFFGGLRF